MRKFYNEFNICYMNFYLYVPKETSSLMAERDVILKLKCIEIYIKTIKEMFKSNTFLI